MNIAPIALEDYSSGSLVLIRDFGTRAQTLPYSNPLTDEEKQIIWINELNKAYCPVCFKQHVPPHQAETESVLGKHERSVSGDTTGETAAGTPQTEGSERLGQEPLCGKCYGAHDTMDCATAQCLRCKLWHPLGGGDWRNPRVCRHAHYTRIQRGTPMPATEEEWNESRRALRDIGRAPMLRDEHITAAVRKLVMWKLIAL